MLGSVVFVGRPEELEGGEVEYKLAQSIARLPWPPYGGIRKTGSEKLPVFCACPIEKEGLQPGPEEIQSVLVHDLLDQGGGDVPSGQIVPQSRRLNGTVQTGGQVGSVEVGA